MHTRRLRLADPELLRLLMRFAPGGPLTVRKLAEAARVSKSKVHHMTQGTRPTVAPDVADRIAKAVHIDRDVLFLPRASTSVDVDDSTGS